MSFETYDHLQGIAADATPGERAMLAMEAADRREAAQEAQQRAEREAAQAERMEALALADRQMGNPLAELSRARADVSDLQDRVADLRDQLERAQAKLTSAQSSQTFWAERLATATESVERSVRRDPFEAARARATDAHREFAAKTRELKRSAAAGEGRRPVPKGRGGDAVRAGEAQQCKDCRELGATDEESFAIHHGLVDVPAEQPVTVPAYDPAPDRCQHGFVRPSCLECRAGAMRARFGGREISR